MGGKAHTMTTIPVGNLLLFQGDLLARPGTNHANACSTRLCMHVY